MLATFTLLLLFQLVGEVIVLAGALPVPGPVVGMLLLFMALALRGGPSAAQRGHAQGLLQHLALLFVPAGTGVMLHLQRLADEGTPLTLALVLSTLITLAVTALLLQALTRRHGMKDGQ